MNIDISFNDLKRFKEVSKCSSSLVEAKLESHYGGDRHKIRLSLDELAASDLGKLHGWLKANVHGDNNLAAPLRKISTYMSLKADPKGGKVKSLESLVTALKGYIGPSPHKWLFSERKSDGHLLPYYVASIEYHPGRRDEPASTRVELEAFSRGSNDRSHITWHQKDLDAHATVVSLLESEGYFLETEDAIAEHTKDVKLYLEWQPQTGEQFLASGFAQGGSRWWSEGIAMNRDGQPTKVVMDDYGENEDDRHRPTARDGVTSTSFWDSGDEDESEGSVALPLHPYVQVFDLDKHQYIIIHARNLQPYRYDPNLFEKLVLPTDVKDLVHILVSGSSDQLDDIIKGKTGGTIIITTGPPGTGKTLTAEVFSEAIKRPLYVVQCSQLGTDEENVEKRLREVLDRATRWRAILLIDEADVYVHERGSDVQQNALVGVFLRVLEYYRGVLFMTSNRATIIDDAIMSRATAWIQYELPTTEEALKIWAILAKQFNIELSAATIRELEKRPFGRLSGRNIKNLLKLGKRLATARKVPIDIHVLTSAVRFLDLRNDEVLYAGTKPSEKT